MPNGLSELGYSKADLPALVKGAWPQQRLLKNAPVQVTEKDLGHLFSGAIRYW